MKWWFDWMHGVLFRIQSIVWGCSLQISLIYTHLNNKCLEHKKHAILWKWLLYNLKKCSHRFWTWYKWLYTGLLLPCLFALLHLQLVCPILILSRQCNIRYIHFLNNTVIYELIWICPVYYLPNDKEGKGGRNKMGANISCMNMYSTCALKTEMFQGTNLIDLLEKFGFVWIKFWFK